MVKKPPIALNPQENRAAAPASWPEIQDSLAEASGLALLLVEGYQPPAIAVSNNNSVCHTFQTSPQYSQLCDPYCGAAHARATEAGGVVEYKCHAGLTCFAKPIDFGGKQKLAIIGGRAFVKSSDYLQLMEKFRTGELQSIASDEVFSNVLFTEPQRLVELAERIDRAAQQLHAASAKGASGLHLVKPVVQPATVPVKETTAPRANTELELELERLRSELEFRSRFTGSLQHFLERISGPDPVRIYDSIVNSSKELLRSERASLIVLDENTNQLIQKAASGLSTDPASVGPVRTGEGVSGEVIETGKAVMVTDLRVAGRKPAPADRRYKTNSFISYPITIGGRKVGVLNITDKSGGGTYDEVDLSLLEIVGPQIAVALEKAGWQERANQFQQESVTDELTGLHNHRYLEERLPEELSRAKRYEQPVSFLMIDIDDFKKYNDRNGHEAGNEALQNVAQCLKDGLRSADVAMRYGGEEFCILLPQTALAEARAIAERIRHHVESTPFPHGESQPLGRVTISVGVSTYSKNVDTDKKIIAAADRALYESKSFGKNRVEYYRDLEE